MIGIRPRCPSSLHPPNPDGPVRRRCAAPVLLALLLVLPAIAGAAVPPIPGQPVLGCDAVVGGQCYVNGSFTISMSSAGAHHFKICRSNDTTGWGGCNAVISTNASSPFTISGSDLPSDGFRRAYYVKACDAADNCTTWAQNQEAYAEMDLTGPDAPGNTSVQCAYQVGGLCWVVGPFAASVTPASDGGSGVGPYDWCRSIDRTSGFGGCDVNLTTSGTTSYYVSGSALPSPGSFRNYWVRTRDNVGNVGAWNSPVQVRRDPYAPAVSANNASTQWFVSRTATVSAADTIGGAAANSGLAQVRYRWNATLNGACTNGTVTSNGATLTVPSGDNHLYVCARDNTGRIAQWNGGPYRVLQPCPIQDDVTVRPCTGGSSSLAAAPLADRDMPALGDYQLHERLVDKLVLYSLEDIEPAALRAELEATGRIGLRVNGLFQELELVPADIRGPGFRMERTGPSGTEEVAPGPAVTFRGSVVGEPGSAVRMVVSDDLVMGYVETGGARYFIDPAYKFVPGGGVDRVVVYQDMDLKPEAGVSCSFSEVVQKGGALQAMADRGHDEGALGSGLLVERLSGNNHVVEVATDTDAEYYALHGSSVYSHIQGILNMVNGIYQDVNLTFQVVYQHAYTNASTDAYDTCDAYGQWCELWRDWETNRTGVQRDIAHLFSAKKLMLDRATGGEVRIRGTSGMLGTVCKAGEAYSLSTNYREVGLVGHEIGHALNGLHLRDLRNPSVDEGEFCPDTDCGNDVCPDPDPAGGPMMCGPIQNPITGIHPRNQTRIDDYANSQSCIASTPGGGS